MHFERREVIMPALKCWSLDDVRCKQMAWRKVYVNHMFYLHFCTSNALKQWIVICDKQIISRGFVYRPQYQPSAIISPRAKALMLIMGSRVDTSGDNQKCREIISNYPATIFVLKMLSAFYIFCIYSSALQTRLFHGSKQFETRSDCSKRSSLIWVHIVCN